MIDNQLLAMLRCPDDHSALTPADPGLVERVNKAIRAKELCNLAGQQLKKPLGGGLVRAAGDRLYPIVDEIPVMLHDEAIDLSQLN